MTQSVVPTDSRYIPFVQQPYCCGPACVQMILYKNGLPLLSQEEIGADLGLVVPSDQKDAFYKPDYRDTPAVASGFGTRIQEPEYGLDKLIEKHDWRFKLSLELASSFSSQSGLINRLKNLVKEDDDTLICFQNDHGTGHICVVDIVDEAIVRVMDPSQHYPKWRRMSHNEIFDRVTAHGDANFGGLWILTKQ